MSWSTTKKPENVKAFLIGKINGVYGNITSKVLEAKLVDKKTLYLAVEKTNADTQETTVGAIVIITDTSTDKTDIYDFFYKIMSENECPAETRCPASILDKLTPTDNENATYWRAACRKHVYKPLPKPEQYLVFDEAISFSNGMKESRFLTKRHGRNGLMFQSLTHDFLCKISKLKDQNYRIYNSLAEIPANASN